MKKYISKRFVFLSVALLLASKTSIAEMSVRKNEVTGLLTWTADSNGFKIELIQLIPDFVRAIYAKHNFPKHEVERVASY